MALTKTSNQVIQQPYRKNFLINGCMRVAQRAVANISNSTQFGAVDRWKARLTTATAGTITQLTTASTTVNAHALLLAGMSCSAGGLVVIEQYIESRNSVYLRGKTITFSCLLYHDFGATTNFTFYLYNPTAKDDFTSSTQFANSPAIPIPHNAYTRMTWTVTLGATDATNGLRFQILSDAVTLTAKGVAVGEAQLELGSVATPFEFRPYAQELALCQRYYEKSDNAIWSGMSTSGSPYYLTIPYKVTKRVAPIKTAAVVYNNGFPNNPPTLSGGGSEVFMAEMVAASTTPSSYFQFSWTADAEF